jgi:hypothetical protein
LLQWILASVDPGRIHLTDLAPIPCNQALPAPGRMPRGAPPVVGPEWDCGPCAGRGSCGPTPALEEPPAARPIGPREPWVVRERRHRSGEADVGVTSDVL